MKLRICLFYLFFIQLSVAFSFGKSAQAGNPSPHGLFIWLKNGTEQEKIELDQLIERSNIGSYSITKAFTTRDEVLDRIYVLTNISKEVADKISLLLKAEAWIELVEDIPEYYFFYTPNDLQSVQWNLKKIQAEKAWDLCKGGKSIVVALVDDGMDTAHSDLKNTLWHNIKEIPGNGKDDDGNGYIDDYFGWDVADNDNNPCVVPSDGLNHGTHCAGIMGATTDNSNGIASVGFNIKIMPLKCGKKGSGVAIFNPYSGVDYAIRNGARVISMSWGGGSYSATYQALFDVAFKKNIVCVAAAGNASTSTIGYPAGYNHVIAVGSTTSTDAISGTSNFGTWIDVMAPGNSIYSTIPGNIYGYMSGTSMACPLVSGLCGLMLSKNQFYSNVQIENCLKSGCDNINAVNTGYVGLLGAGRINAYKSLMCTKSVNALFGSDKLVLCPGDSAHFRDSSFTGITNWKWSFVGGNPSTSTLKNPAVKYGAIGTFDVQLIVGNGTDFDTLLKKNYITVSTPTAKMSGKQTIVPGDYATLRVDLTDVGPWDFQYTDGKKNYTITNIQSTPYFILIRPDSTKTYKPVWVKRSGCTGSVSDSSVVIVYNPNPAMCDSLLRFQYRFGGSGDDQGLMISVLDDTSFVVVGKTNSYGAGSYDAFLAKVTNTGKVIWFKTVGGTSDDGFLYCAVDNSGNIYAGGYINSGLSGRASLLTKYDKNGNQLWFKSYGRSGEYIYNVAISKDQKYVYFNGLSVLGGFGSEDFMVYKLDVSGTVIWIKQIGDAGLNRNWGFYEDDFGNVYTAGPTGSPSYSDGLIVKMDKNGSMLWKKKYTDGSSTLSKGFQKMCKWNNTRFIIVGYIYNTSTSTFEGWCNMIDTGGSIIWSNRYKIGNNQFAEVQIMNKTIVISGYSNTKNNDGNIMQLDSNGNVLKNILIGASTAEIIYGSFTDKHNCWYFTGVQTNSNNDVWVGRTNCKLDFNCNFASNTPTVNAVVLTSSSYSLSIQSFSTTASPTNTKGSNSTTFTLICKTGVDSLPPKSCILKADFLYTPECTGNDVKFKDISTDAGGFTISNYFWNFGDSISASGASSVFHKFKQNKTYKVKLIVYSTDGKRTCIDSILKNYISSDKLRFRDKLRDTFICFGDSAKLAKFNPDCGITPYNYRWSPTSGVSDTADPAPYFSPRKTTNYVLKISDFSGQSVYDTFIITVKPTCCKSFARFVPKKQSVCFGDSAELINTSTFKKKAVFNWKFTGSKLTKYTGFNPPKILFDTLGIQTVTLFLSDSCKNDTFVLKLNIIKTPKAYAGNDTILCLIDTINLGGQAQDWYQYEWSPKAGLDNPYISSPVAIITTPLNYILKITSDNGCIGYDTISIKQYKVNPFIGNDTTLCTGKNIWLKSNIKIPPFLWNTGATVDSILVKKYGVYWLEVADHGCKFRDTIKIFYDTMPVFSLGNDTILCENKKPFVINTFKIKWPGAVKLWDNGSTGNSRSANVSGTYWLQMQNNNCKYRDSINVKFDKMPTWTLGPDTDVCSDGFPVLLSPRGNFSGVSKFLWSNLSVSQTIFANGPGMYWLELTDKTCKSRDSIQINMDVVPAFTLGNDTTLCNNKIPFLVTAQNIKWPAALKFWDNGSSGGSRLIYSNGTYWLEMQNKKCKYRDSITINFDAMPFWTLGPDTTICNTALPFLLSPVGNFSAVTKFLWNNLSGAKTLSASSGLYWLELTDKTCKSRDSIQINVDIMPAFTLGNDTSICESNKNLQLAPFNVSMPSASKLWDNGNVSFSRFASKTGLYWLQMKNNNCIYRDSIKVVFDTMAAFSLGKDTGFCETVNSLSIQPSGNIPANSSYRWENGSVSKSKNVSKSGLYWLEIENKTCISRDSVFVQVDSVPTFTLGADSVFCDIKFPVVLIPKNIRISSAAYLWDDNSKLNARNVSNIGSYYLKMINRTCEYSDSIHIDSLQRPYVKFPEDTTICVGDTIFLKAPLFTGANYLWSNGSKGISYDAVFEGIYNLRITNKCGSAFDQINIHNKDCNCPIYIPNSFSPQHSVNINDEYHLVFDCPMEKFEISIYNRWGERIYHSTDTAFKWDGTSNGKPVPNGTYYLVLRLKQKYENNGKEYLKSGFIYVAE